VYCVYRGRLCCVLSCTEFVSFSCSRTRTTLVEKCESFANERERNVEVIHCASYLKQSRLENGSEDRLSNVLSLQMTQLYCSASRV
jgi:hypothetical protein